MNKPEIIPAVLAELVKADVKHPPMAEIVEGFYTLKCEVTELEREVHRFHKDPQAMIGEAIQVTAMGVKFLRDCCDIPIGDFKLPEEESVDLDNLSIRGREWQAFSDKVLRHIEEYTVPQYGDKGSDRASQYTTEVVAEHIGRYRDRMGTNSRGQVEAIRDLIKIAHYASMAHDIEIKKAPK